MYIHFLHIETLERDGCYRTIMLQPNRKLGEIGVWFPDEMTGSGTAPVGLPESYVEEYRKRSDKSVGPQQLGPRLRKKTNGGTLVTRNVGSIPYQDGRQSLYILCLPRDTVPTAVDVRVPSEGRGRWPCEIRYNPDTERWAVYVECGHQDGTGTFTCQVMCQYRNIGTTGTSDEAVASLQKLLAAIPFTPASRTNVTVANSPGASVNIAGGDQHIVNGIDTQALVEAIRLTQQWLADAETRHASADVLTAVRQELATLEHTRSSGRAKVMREAADSLRNIIEGATGGLVTTGLMYHHEVVELLKRLAGIT